MSSIGTKVADSILHRERKIDIAGEVFVVAPPVMETLILISEKISEIPAHNYTEKEMLFGALANARYFRPMADAVAILILGANRLRIEREEEKSYLFGKIKRSKRVEIDEMARVSKLLRCNKSNREILELLKQLLEGLQVGDFFVLSSILQEINLMGQATTTALGQ